MQSLHHKLEETRRILASLLGGRDSSRIALAWTGGKDSTVVLDLWREILGASPVLAVNLDTGHKFPWPAITPPCGTLSRHDASCRSGVRPQSMRCRATWTLLICARSTS